MKKVRDQSLDLVADEMTKAMGAMLPALIGGASRLTQIIVNNRLSKGEKLSDEDIYKIYQTSLKECTYSDFGDDSCCME